MRSSLFAFALAAAVAAPALAAPSTELRARARALMEAGTPEEAATLLEEAIRTTPDDAEAWAELGNARLALGAFPQASTAFEQAVKLAPDLSTAQYNLAYALRKSGKLQRAAEAYRLYLARYPNDADAHFGLGESLRGLGDPIAAAEAFERYATTETRPDRAPWVEKARTWAKELRASEVKPVVSGVAAEPHMSFAAPARESPDGAAAPAAHHPPELSAGIALLRQNRFAEALVELRKAEAARPDDPWLQMAIGSALLGADEPEDAAVRYTRALVSAPASAHAGIRIGLAECARRQGDDARAQAQYRAILSDAAAPPQLQAIARERLGAPAAR